MSHPDLSPSSPLWAKLLTGTGATGTDDGEKLRSALPRQRRFALRADPARDDRSTRATDGQDRDQGSVSRGRWDTSGGGRPDGGALRQARGRGDCDGPNFNLKVPENGYAWWYVDGISGDGKRAISVIGFIGSVFSPWYRWSGRKNPEDHVCINVATYGPGGRFTMTDRGTPALRQSETTLTVGPSSMTWENDKLVIDVDEVSGPPIISRVRGTITVTPSAITDVELALTDDGAHIWRPFGPVSGISVGLEAPGWTWEGHGYFDANFGTRALEEDFTYWTWGRYPAQRGSTCFYDATRLDGSTLGAGFHFDSDGAASEPDLPPKTKFTRSLWAVKRETRSDPGYQPRQVMNMLDAPLYSRSMVETRLDAEATVGVHEALDLKRFRSPLLKPMLAMRVPRRRNWSFD